MVDEAQLQAGERLDEADLDDVTVRLEISTLFVHGEKIAIPGRTPGDVVDSENNGESTRDTWHAVTLPSRPVSSKSPPPFLGRPLPPSIIVSLPGPFGDEP